MRFSYYRNTALVALCLVLVISLAAWAAPNKKLKAKHSDPDAIEAMQEAYSSTFKLRELKADVNLVIQNENFLKGYFDSNDALSNVGIKGVLHYTSKNGGMLLLRRDTDYYNCFQVGNRVSFLGVRKVKRKKGNVIKIEEQSADNAYPDGSSAEPSPSPSASPSPSPSPSPFGLVNVEEQLAFDTMMNSFTSTNQTAGPYNPLSFILPYTLASRIHGYTFMVCNRDVPVYTDRCMEVEALSPRGQDITYIWVSNNDHRVVQVQSIHKKEHLKITATYTGKYDIKPEVGFLPFQRLEVSVNGNPVYFAELTNVEINPEKILVEQSAPENPSALTRAKNIMADEVVPFLTEQTLKIVIFLCLALLILGLRYIAFAASRQEFSDEIMVVDEEKGRFSETLTKLGYKIVPFSVEALSNERTILGKGATKDTTSRPRSLIIAPESFNEIRNHAFLIRAYVEEGGRALIMRHPKSMESAFPFNAEMMPIPNVGVVASGNTNIIAGLNDEAMRRLAATYVTTEGYLKINDRPFKPVMLSLTNKLTKVTATSVGVVRQRKGEYMVCQMHITNQGLREDTNLQVFFNDMIRYLLGLEPLPYEDTSDSSN